MKVMTPQQKAAFKGDESCSIYTAGYDRLYHLCLKEIAPYISGAEFETVKRACAENASD